MSVHFTRFSELSEMWNVQFCVDGGTNDDDEEDDDDCGACAGDDYR